MSGEEAGWRYEAKKDGTVTIQRPNREFVFEYEYMWANGEVIFAFPNNGDLFPIVQGGAVHIICQTMTRRVKAYITEEVLK